MAVVTAAGKITFTYTFAGIEEQAQMESARVAQSLVSEKGTAGVDAFAISDDEQDLVRSKFKEAARYVFRNLSKLTYGIANAVSISDSQAVVIINDNEGNAASVADADDFIQKALLNYVLAAWFSYRKVADTSNLFYVQYTSNVRELLRASYYLRIPK